MLRVEDQRLLIGQGRFVERIVLPAMLHAVFVRSPHAHARILAIDTEEARTRPGVVAVYTGADLAAAGVHPLPCLRRIPSADGTPFQGPVRHPLAVGTVRHVGDPVVMLVAETLAAAQDAAEAVVVEYEPLGPNLDPRATPERAFTWTLGDAAAVDAAFAAAAHTVRVDIHNPRIVMAPLEPRSAVGIHDAGRGDYCLWTQSQGVHLIRNVVAQTLGVEPETLQVVTEDVGGSFGMKLVNYPEQTCVLAAARLLGRPVRWVSTRSEAFLTDCQGRDQTSTAELALDAEGRFLALRVVTYGNLGAYPSTLGPSTLSTGFSKTIGHVYAIPLIHVTVHCVYTNTVPTDAYRGSGKPESIFLVERLIERAARTLGIDRIELRRRNLVPPTSMPYKAANGHTYDCGDFAAVLDGALREIDWRNFPDRQDAAARAGLRRGIGLGMYLHLTGGSTVEVSRVELAPGGAVRVHSGTQSGGQGHETALAQLVAERLQLPLAAVAVAQGDSAALPRGGGTSGSSVLQLGGTTIVRALDHMLDRARTLAADRLETAEVDLVYRGGRFAIAGTDRSIGLLELATAHAGDLPDCAGSAEFAGELLTAPYGAYACEVEIDPATGHTRIVRFCGVDDIGRRLNPMLAMGQIHGAIAQGLGQAFLERTVYDPDSGQLLSGSFMDYALPRASDLPDFEMGAADIPTGANPLGMKGAGEIGCLGAPAAFINAVADAIGHDEIEMPATPERVWRALHQREGELP